MVTSKYAALAAARARVARLEQAVARELHRDLAALPARYGFATVKAFAAAVQAAGKSRGRQAAPQTAARKRRQRAKITDATRAQVKKLVEAGRTGGEIAQAVGISLPSVQNIKKALGLVRARK